jgi:hypothetical protein
MINLYTAEPVCLNNAQNQNLGKHLSMKWNRITIVHMINSQGLIITFPDEEKPTVKYPTIITLILVFIILILVIVGTVVDQTSLFELKNTSESDTSDRGSSFYTNRESLYNLHRKNKMGLFLASFSIPRNYSRIFLDPFSMPPELAIFNGLFVIGFIGTVFHNVYYISVMYGITESSKLSEYSEKFPHFLVLRSGFAYELLFFSIGFTFCVKLMNR